MMPTRRVISPILVLVCTLALAQGRSSNTRAQEAEAFRDLHLEIAKQAKEQTDKVLANFSKWIENYKHNADKYNDLHPQIQAIVHEQVKQTVEKHVKDSLNEVINSAKLISSAQRNSQLTRDSRDSQHQNNRRNDNRNKNKQCDESEEASSSSQNKNEVNSESINAVYLARFMSEFTDALNKIEKLKFKLGNTWDAKENLTKAQLISKLDELREDLHKPAPSSSDNKDSSFGEDDESDDIDENVDDVNVIIESEINAIKHNIDIHREIRNHIFETLEFEIKALRSAKLEALNGKAELIQAANKLHASFDFQSLAQFKRKIFEVSVRKKQYINQRLLFKRQVKEAITDFKSNPGRTTNSVQEQSTEESEETVTHVSLETAGRVGHTTEHVELTTKHVKYTTEHAGHTTEHIGHTTDDAEHTTEHDGVIPTQAVVSHQTSTNSHSAPEENQTPDEHADIEDGGGVYSSPDEIESERTQNSSSTDADASTQNGGESSSSQLRSVAGRAYNSSSNNANNSDASGLKLAANYKGSGDADDGDGSGTVVVVVVLSCLVICSVVSILGVLLWKRHRRHRLYTKIPSGDLSRQFI